MAGGEHVALAASQAARRLAAILENCLYTVGATRSRNPARHSAGWGLMLVWMKCRAVVQAEGRVGLYSAVKRE